jgi:DNA polymerase-3 subunit epsilon
VPILFFDTETTGKAARGKPPTDEAQPDLVQLGAILTDDDLNELITLDRIVFPTYWTIPDEAAAIHGISQAKAEAEGLSLPDVMDVFCALLGVAQRVVAHNSDFDVIIIQRALARLKRPVTDPFVGKEVRCTMKASKPILQLPNRNPYINDKYKFPKLVEVHQHYFGVGIDGAHDALVDVRATIPVYAKLCEHYGMAP